MRHQRAIELLPIIQAIKDGKAVECRFRGDPINCFWGPNDSRRFDDDYDYRIKNEPVSRPWSKPEDVPGPVCWIRRIGTTEAAQVLNVSNTGCTVVGFFGWAANYKTFQFGKSFEEWEHSTDRKTWLPCTVTE